MKGILLLLLFTYLLNQTFPATWVDRSPTMPWESANLHNLNPVGVSTDSEA